MVARWLPLLLLAAVSAREVHPGHFLNQFVVELREPAHAQTLAEQHGFRVARHVRELGHVFLFAHDGVSRRSRRSAPDDISRRLREHPDVVQVTQERVLKREKRASVRSRSTINHHKDLDYPITLNDRDDWVNELEFESKKKPLPSTEEMGINFNDPLFPEMWYLVNTGQTGGPKGYDVNVLPVWRKNITGRGVVVTILDDGMDHTHQDLIKNYDPKASTDLNDDTDNPQPRGDLKENSHGTKCAGEVAAEANNSICALGIAYNANIGGVRMLDGSVTDSLEAQALLFNNDYIDIYSASWGPSDNGKTMEGMGVHASKAMRTGVEEGRHGKGSLYVWATGNGGANDDDCNCDGYVSSIYSISIGCINDKGLSTYFSEICPSTMAVIFTGGAHAKPGKRGFPDPNLRVSTVDVGNKCTDRFQGTSAAAPLAAGLFALVLEANPALTWRDAQNLVVETAHLCNGVEDGTVINGAGYHVNHRFGFGCLDAGKMVEGAQNWNTTAEQRNCTVEADNGKAAILSGKSVNQTLKVSASTSTCKGARRLDRLEHVQVKVRLDHERRGDLSLWLYSPHGTPSQILSPRVNDDNEDIDWVFMTVHNWGENPDGTWTLSVEDVSEGKEGKERGTLLEWSLVLFGVQGENPNAGLGRSSGANTGKPSSPRQPKEAEGEAHAADQEELEEILSNEQEAAESVVIRKFAEEGGPLSRLAEALLARAGHYRRKKQFVEEALGHDKREMLDDDRADDDLSDDDLSDDDLIELLTRLERRLEEEEIEKEEREKEEREKEEREKQEREKQEREKEREKKEAAKRRLVELRAKEEEKKRKELARQEEARREAMEEKSYARLLAKRLQEKSAEELDELISALEQLLHEEI